jgi:Raf kinase inhibitor-like YbhB/YbcL family protein
MNSIVSKRTIMKVLFFGAAMLVVGRSSALTLSSPSFKDGDPIPVQHACTRLAGQNSSPALNWSDVPAETKSLAIVAYDRDVPGKRFYHWIIGNIPPTISGLQAGIPAVSPYERGIIQGINSAGKLGYFGPCPPASEQHHYAFDLFAFDTILPASAFHDKTSLGEAMAHLEQLKPLKRTQRAVLVGTFKNE